MTTDTTTPDLLTPSANPEILESSQSSPPPVPETSPPAVPSPQPQRNVLNFSKRTKLSLWLDPEPMRTRAARESDSLLAEEATTALGFLITAPNITAMRRELSISKIKPEPPAAPTTPEDIDLIALHKQFEAHKLECQAARLEANSTREVVNLLIQHVRASEEIFSRMTYGGDVTTSIESLDKLPALKPLPASSIQHPASSI